MNTYSGFMRSDKLLGSFEVKLADFEAKAEIHDSFDVSMGVVAILDFHCRWCGGVWGPKSLVN